MFQRRLGMLAMAAAVACVPVAAQLTRLAVVEGVQRRAEAEARLQRRSWHPTHRGRILDRFGRVLALDRPAFDVALDYSVLTGDWAEQRAGEYVRERYRAVWSRLDDRQRSALQRQAAPLFHAHLDRLMELLAAQAGLPRAELERRRADIIDRVEAMYAHVVEARRQRELQRLAGERRWWRRDDADQLAQLERRIRQPIAEQRAPHTLLPRVDDRLGFELLRLADERVHLSGRPPRPDDPAFELVELAPGLHVVDVSDRAYPFDTVTVDVDLRTLPGPLRREASQSVTVEGVASHVLGRMRRGVHREDMEARQRALEADPELARRSYIELDGGGPVDRGRYELTDAVGARGLEAHYEHWLRGLRGVRIEQLESGQTRSVEPEPGRDLRLTLDIMLQARIRAAMSPQLGLARVQPWHDNPSLPVGTALAGAAVVLDIDAGDILALVSTPPRLDQAEAAPGALADPLVHRAIATPYPPGSIAKALVLASAISRGVLDPAGRIACTGHLLPDRPDLFRCWIFTRFGTTHSDVLGHDPDPRESLMVSCNIFYYTLGRRLGVEGIVDTYRRFGVGESAGLGLDQEYPGGVERFGGGRLQLQDAMMMAMGQGPVTWTPLHAADAYATLARGGVRVQPRLVLTDQPPVVHETGLSEAGLEAALAGLFLAVNDPRFGTGEHLTIDGRREPIFNVPGVRVWGKTGTAQAPQREVDLDGSGPAPARLMQGDHSWFVVLAGPAGHGASRPMYAIAVVMEYAGSGARVSGPIVNQIIHALRAEGYL